MTANTQFDATPNFERVVYTKQERWYLEPFFSNLDRPVYASLIFSPEVIGALCSRASRAAGDLRRIFLDEYVLPFVEPERSEKDTDEAWQAKVKHGGDLKAFIEFLHAHPVADLFSNPRARSFYIKWLAQYGDDSIAQLAGMHIGFQSISNIAIKHLEDQRIGLAPIEKSTRYVNYSNKVNGQYLYYTDPTIAELGLEHGYRAALDGLFDTYTALLPELQTYFSSKFPDEKANVVEKKAFDTLRGLLPMATLSQVAFFGNGQAFEYLVSRCGDHPSVEIRWVADQVIREIDAVAPAFVRRQTDPDKQAGVWDYKQYLGRRRERVAPLVDRTFGDTLVHAQNRSAVRLVEYDRDGEAKILAGILYSAPNNHRAWDENLEAVKLMSADDQRSILEAYLAGRTARWQKVGRAFENAYVRFEIEMDIGAWRDLHRHRMHSQQRQNFSPHHGYNLPSDVTEAGFANQYEAAINRAEEIYYKLAAYDQELAQYAVTFAHRIRFMQYANLRSCFWEMELRTIPEGHPDYRVIEQEKFRQLAKVYPLITEFMHVNMDSYDFARRGQEERIAAKLKALEATVEA